MTTQNPVTLELLELLNLYLEISIGRQWKPQVESTLLAAKYATE